MTQRKDSGIYEVSEGVFRVVVPTRRRLPSGRFAQAVEIVRGTLTDARNRRDELKVDVRRNRRVPPTHETLGAYLPAWLERVKPPHGRIKVATWKSYESHVRVHLVSDRIAQHRLSDVTPTDVEDLFRRLLEKGLSPSTVDAVRRTLRAALNAHPQLSVNPVKRAVSPRVPRHEVDPDELWSADEARRFLAHAEKEDPDTGALVRLALDSGARLGELLALTWPDIDTTSGTVRIRRSVSQKRLPGDERKLRFDTPKSDKSRTLELDATTIAAIREIRDRQKMEQVADVGKLVFRRPTPQGLQPWRLDVTTHVFQRLSTEARVPVMPFHYLRHCCASWLLGAGMGGSKQVRNLR